MRNTGKNDRSSKPYPDGKSKFLWSRRSSSLSVEPKSDIGSSDWSTSFWTSWTSLGSTSLVESSEQKMSGYQFETMTEVTETNRITGKWRSKNTGWSDGHEDLWVRFSRDLSIDRFIFFEIYNEWWRKLWGWSWYWRWNGCFSQEVQELVAENLFNTIADLCLLKEQWTLYKNPKDMGIKDISDGQYTWTSKAIIVDFF